MSDDLVIRLHDEAMRLSGQSIDRGCVDSGIASNLADAAADALTEARAEIERLREAAKGQLVVINTAIAERERAERNRDMWKDQCERQAARLELLHAAIKRQVDNIERWRETGKPASPDESKSIYEQLVAALNG